MKRRDLFRSAREIASEIEKGSYADWAKKEYPITYEIVFEGCELQVEIILLENRKDYIQLGVAVDDGWLSAYSPAGVSAIIYNEEG